MKIDDARLRSCRRGTLAVDEAKKLAEKISNEAVRQGVLEALSDLDSYDGDVVCHDGDLVVDEGFSTEGAIAVFVLGNLTVKGIYEDTCNDAPDVVVIEGNLDADHVITAGTLEVRGDLSARGCVCGDYNDGAALVHGALRARFFFPEQHHFTVKGKVDVTTLAGNHHRLASSFPVVFANNEDLHGVVADEYVVKDPEGRSWLFEKKSYREFLNALRRGEAVLATS